MVKDKFDQVVYSILKDELRKEDIKCVVNGQECKYIFRLKEASCEFVFDFIDNFYKIKLEFFQNNNLMDVVYLSKSLQFKKQILRTIKKENLDPKAIQSHIVAVFLIIKSEMKSNGSLFDLKQIYPPNMKFDGIFLKKQAF